MDRYEIGIITTSELDGSQLLDTAIEWPGALDQECVVSHLDSGQYLVKIIVESDEDPCTLLDTAVDAEDLGEIDDQATYVKALTEEYPYFVGARVVALGPMVEGDHVHAKKGDLGTVEHVETGMGAPFPTVFFDKSGTGTRVEAFEIELSE